MIDKPGIYFDIAAVDYFYDPCIKPSLTQSIAKTLLDRSPAHARLEHPRLALPKDADEEAEKYVAAQAIGNAAHSMLIGRGKDLAEANFDNFRTKASQEFRALNEAAGRTVVLSKHLEQASNIVTATRQQLDAVGWKTAFREGHGEVVIAWQEGDLWLRSMLDWYDEQGDVYDLKTTGLSVAPHVVGRMAAEAGWDIQAAMHERGLNWTEINRKARRDYRFVAVENEPPYALTAFQMSEAWLTLGRKKLNVAVDIWSRCIATGQWPAYPLQPTTPEYPMYKEANWLSREIGEFGNLTVLDAG
jgi:PDDEXK-like uncharacterized protein DUF3799